MDPNGEWVMFQPWPEAANGGDPGCDCDECGVSKRRKRSRNVLPSSNGGPSVTAPPLPAQPPAPTAPGAPSPHVAAEAESRRKLGQASEPAVQLAAGAGLRDGAETAGLLQLDEWTVEGDSGTEWIVEGDCYLRESAERIYATRTNAYDRRVDRAHDLRGAPQLRPLACTARIVRSSQ